MAVFDVRQIQLTWKPSVLTFLLVQSWQKQLTGFSLNATYTPLLFTRVGVCNRVDNTHPDTLAQTFYLRPVTLGFGCLELVAMVSSHTSC